MTVKGCCVAVFFIAPAHACRHVRIAGEPCLIHVIHQPDTACLILNQTSHAAPDACDMLPDPASPHLVVSLSRWLSSSVASPAAAAAVTVQGDMSAVLAQVDGVVSREDASPKDVADAAMALAYLQARGDRRCAHRGRPGSSRAELPPSCPDTSMSLACTPQHSLHGCCEPVLPNLCCTVSGARCSGRCAYC